MAQIIIFTILSTYIVFLILVLLYISKKHTATKCRHQPKVAVIVAFRNEEKNLKSLIVSLLNQEYQNFDCYLVNDHSNDNFNKIIESFNDERLHIFHLPEKETGKKRALNFGVLNSESELILFTDADCWMGKNWIYTMVSQFETNNCDWMSGPIQIDSSGTWIEDFQQLESAYLTAISGFCIDNKTPTTCSGANLIMKRTVFIESKGFDGIEKTPSGDDELLMQKLALNGFSLKFNKNKDSIVFTTAQNTISQALNQRIRWASKLKYNLLKYNFILSVLIFLFHLASIAVLIIDWKLGIVFWILRFITEYILAKQIFKWFDCPLKMIHFLISFFVYPLYVIFMSVATQLKAYQWKERNY